MLILEFFGVGIALCGAGRKCHFSRLIGEGIENLEKCSMWKNEVPRLKKVHKMWNIYRRRIHKLMGYMQEAKPYKSLISQLYDLVFHKLKINTHFSDYYHFKFYKGDKSWEEKSRFVSLEGSKYWPYEDNFLKFNIIFTNKYIQKCIIHGLGLPTPKMLSTIGETFEIRTKNQLFSFFESHNGECAIKPVSGTHGNNILILHHLQNGFIAGETYYTIEAIWNHVLNDFQRGYIIEEKISNSEEIESIYSGSLNTFRVVTIKLRDQGWCPVISYLKLGRGNSQVDNLSAGGILALFDESGRVVSAYDVHRSQSITHHPDSGVQLVGFEIDNFKSIVDFALAASEKLGFMGSIGWDIALTNDGPLIIEANGAWGANVIQRATGKGVITDEMAKNLKKRRAFGSWNKTRMYPGFNRNGRQV